MNEIPTPESNNPPCPRCGSAMIVRVGQQKHCNGCSHDFDQPAEWLAKRPVTPRIGWNAK
jgi:tRNA(Ile2) C34 agmatinyltransferase TiaS